MSIDDCSHPKGISKRMLVSVDGFYGDYCRGHIEEGQNGAAYAKECRRCRHHIGFRELIKNRRQI